MNDKKLSCFLLLQPMCVWMYKYKSSVKLSILKSNRIVPEMKSQTMLDGFGGFLLNKFPNTAFLSFTINRNLHCSTEWVHNTKCSYFNHSLCKQTFENIFLDERAIYSSYFGIIEKNSVWGCDWMCVNVTGLDSGLDLTSRSSSLPGKVFSKWRPFEIFYEQYNSL